MQNNNDEKAKQISNRLSRVIGQLQAVKRMTEEKRECSDVLIQLLAARSALDSASKLILQDHVNACLQKAVESNDTAAVNELNNLISKFM